MSSAWQHSHPRVGLRRREWRACVLVCRVSKHSRLLCRAATDSHLSLRAIWQGRRIACARGPHRQHHAVPSELSRARCLRIRLLQCFPTWPNEPGASPLRIWDSTVVFSMTVLCLCLVCMLAGIPFCFFETPMFPSAVVFSGGNLEAHAWRGVPCSCTEQTFIGIVDSGRTDVYWDFRFGSR